MRSAWSENRLSDHFPIVTDSKSMWSAFQGTKLTILWNVSWWHKKGHQLPSL